MNGEKMEVTWNPSKLPSEDASVSSDRGDVQVEVLVKSQSTVRRTEVRTHVLALLDRHSLIIGPYKWTEFDDDFLTNNVASVAVVDIDGMAPLDLKANKLCIYIFSLNDDGPSTLNLEEEEELSAANHWLLPAAEFHGIWESLIYEEGIKKQLLDYVSTAIFFSDKNVDSNLVAWNRVVLLHGPPGTGKTSLCKALAQKLSIRMSGRYSYGQFVEINSHSLFSKWFSEVESLTAARNASQAGTEPSDAIRVVNSVLTQLDQIKRYPNVVILTTSNVTEKIDLAFVDRADIKQYIGLPSASAIFNIYLSCLEELMKRQVIYPRQQLLNLEELDTMGYIESDVTGLSLHLQGIARKSTGLSGRTLRKIPFLAHALYAKTSVLTVESFLDAMDKAVVHQLKEREKLVSCS
ncbi:pachytene checkpoint protein 2 homolog isoform X2 [Electrophorus electricus]|uniref:pachytene checkpoint protein 2 homolog isoform X2 n=1 Tax=Electrophorus electricus TaxID=8005 RepID=UPI000F0A2273|nr:pachytene checkpoint protein 2 homolog isoform X2 [Electrophorus electricus]